MECQARWSPFLRPASLFHITLERKIKLSKIYNKYLELKSKNNEKLYLFRCGNFYIFLQEDAIKINEYVVLKITDFAKDVKKCGFPLVSLENYLKVFANHKLDVDVVDEVGVLGEKDKTEKILKRLKKIEIEKMRPLDALVELAKLKEIMDGK